MINNDDYGILINAASTKDVNKFIEALLSILPPIYEKESKESNIYKLYKAISEELVKIDILLDKIKNDNFLSITTDEAIVRSDKNYDIVKNEGMYELIDVRARPKGMYTYIDYYLKTGENIVQLNGYPDENNVFIFEYYIDKDIKIKKDYNHYYNKTYNQLIVFSDVDGLHRIGFLDDGKSVYVSEKIYIERGFFDVGFDEGGFGEFGFSE